MLMKNPINFLSVPYSPRILRRSPNSTLKSGRNLSLHGSNHSMTESDPRLRPLIQWETIPAGVWGTLQTLEVMGNLSRQGSQNDRLRTLAFDCGDVGGVDGWLRSHFVYRPEENEVLRSPEFMLNDFDNLGYCEGDCDDVATLCSSMLKALDIPTRLTAIQTAQDEEYAHVFSEARIGTNWLPIDPTVVADTTYRVFGMLHEPV